MRIKTVRLAWFRGAADEVALEPGGKSMVVYGQNGAGKSSFVDAIEYVVTNGMGRTAAGVRMKARTLGIIPKRARKSSATRGRRASSKPLNPSM